MVGAAEEGVGESVEKERGRERGKEREKKQPLELERQVRLAPRERAERDRD